MPKQPLKWLYPGMKVKRWLLLSIFGVIVVGIGAVFAAEPYIFVSIFGIIWILCGIILIVMGMGKMIVSLLTIFLPQGERELINILYNKRYLERGPKIVTIGGGHGLSHLIFGLKEYTANITAIVTVADSGGSSGRLREEFNIVAPGDIRNCLVALANDPGLMGELFQYRFSKDSALKGHNFGNLFLTAMYHVAGSDFEKAVKETSRILDIRGQVVPSTVHNIHLIAEYMDGSRTQGEDKIPSPHSRIKRISLTQNAFPTQDAMRAIEQADVIILGPGSLFTSVIPNLIIQGISEAIAKSGAFRIYICNVMTQAGETDGLTAGDHVKAIIDHSNRGVIDACLINNGPAPQDALVRYQQENSYPVAADVEKIREMGYHVVAADLLEVTPYLRHDSKKLHSALIKLIEAYRVIKR